MMRVLCAFFLLVLAACSGGRSIAPSGAVPPSLRTQHRTIPVVVRMSFPHRHERHRARSRRSPFYVSQYTNTVKVTFTGGPTAFSQTYTVTPGSGSCPTTKATTTCNWTVALAAGKYIATIVARDASDTILSETNAPAVVAAGTDNALRFTMYAVPTGVGTFLNTNILSPSDALFGNVYDLNNPLSFSIYLYGITEGGHVQVITGAGSPQLTVKRISGTLDVGLTQPAGNPPVFTVSAPGGANFGLATIRVTASFPESDAGICNLPGANCTSPPITFSGRELVAVCCANGLQLYGIDGAGPLATIGSATSGFTAFAFDAQNDLFVASAHAVTEYAPPYAGGTASITNGIAGPVALTISNDGKLFVANSSANPQSVTEYTAPFANAAPVTTITSGIVLPTPPANAPALAVSNYGQADSLVVATSAGVQQYDPPYDSPAAIPNAVNDFFFGAFGSGYGLTASGFTYCAPPSGCNMTAIGTVPGTGYALAVASPSNSVSAQFAYAASTDGNVYAFNTQSTGMNSAAIAGGFSSQPRLMPQNIATDAHGNLAVIDYGGNKVKVYTGVSASPAPVFSGSVTITQAISHPSQVQIVP